MSLAPGSRLGPYEIIAPIGAGGMGEVYRARDTKLDRDVAIKVLPESFALDADRVARFTREAQVLASLNHPNIAQIFGIEEQGGTRALVMELVEGEDLSAHIARGAMPLADVLPIAKQIADALEAAHELGIVHRDLKPANIKLRADGTVKVLDFGLAKAMDPAGASGAGAMNSPTMTARATQMGMIIGTAAYMSPEQARGRAVDRRADIWSFGVVMFEMLSGTRAFEGDDISITLANVMKDDLSWSALPPDLPAPLTRLLRRCLEKDPKRRLSWIGEARHTLDDPASAVASGVSAPAVAAAGPARWLWPAIAALGVAAALVMAALYLTRPQPDPPASVVFEVTAPDLTTGFAISPDGRQLIYRTAKSADRNTWQLWLRSLGSLDARPLPGTQGAQGSAQPLLGVVWSSDSRSIAFSVSGALMRMDIATGQTTEFSKGALGVVQAAGAWSREGVILYGRRSAMEMKGNGVWRVADASNSPAAITALQSGEAFHTPSGFLPDGRHFLYFATKTSDQSSGDVRVGSIDLAPEAQRTDVLLAADGPAVYSSGFLLFVSRGSLLAQPFDAERQVLSGTPALIASGVSPAISVSDAGHIAYRTGGENGGAMSELTHFGRDGRVVGKIGPPAAYGEVMAMADGRRLLVNRTDPGAPNHIQVVDIARGVFSRLSPGNVADYAAAPSPNDTVAYTYSPDGVSRDIYARAANGVGDARVLVKSDTVKHPNAWSPDGRFLIYDDHVPGHSQDLALVGKDGGAPIPFLATEADETFAQFSPDGKWIAYRSTESGRPEIYVRDFAPDRSPAYGTEKIQISVDAGDKPRWNPNGREIFFFHGNTLMAVPVRPNEKPFFVGKPVPLFDTITAGYVPYDVLPDGTFVVNVVVQSGPATAASPLKVLLNWRSALPATLPRR